MSTTGWDLSRGEAWEGDVHVRSALRTMRFQVDRVSMHLQQGAYADAGHDLEAVSSACDELARRLSDRFQLKPPPEIAVQTLGSFRVVLSGSPITNSDWQSRKARTLLKVLISRYGGPVNREVLMEVLWPGEEPTRSASRLSVALSTLRRVLGPDKAHEGDYVVAADWTSVWLRSEHIEVDLWEFMSFARRGLQERHGAQHTSAARYLEQAEDVYRGGFLEEDAYEDWVVGPREEARATYVEVLFALACDAVALGESEAAMRRYRELIEIDPYDECAYLGLIRSLDDSGHHGEALRCYRWYMARMQEIGLESALFPHLAHSP